MYSIVIKLDPKKLANPDLDLRYRLPDLIAEKSGNLIQDDGYDYGEKSDAILVYLTTEDLEKALPIVIDTVENEIVLGNSFNGMVIVATGYDDNYTVVYPPGLEQPFDAS
jgi:hypothetical protein